MMTLPQIRAQLKDRSPHKVAKATGLHYNTVRDIRDREDANPTYRAVEALTKYLESQQIEA